MKGWIGSKSQLVGFLSVVGADQDPEGRYIVGGNITSFMGAGEEFVVDETAYYTVCGARRNLLAGLGATSYGSHVIVI